MKSGRSSLLFLSLGLLLINALAQAPNAIPTGDRYRQFMVTQGELQVTFRDNSESPAMLSGIQSLFHLKHAPDFDAYDPDTDGASAGLNFEHIISGHRSPHNAFTPRKGKYGLFRANDEPSARLIRLKEDSPWKISSTLEYKLVSPNAVDIEFQCQAHDPALFGERGYAIFFFANYMNDVMDPALHFRGITSAGGAEQWIRADAPPGHPDHNHGGTYRHADAAALAYDDDHNFKLNSWSYDTPRFTQPFYFGRAANGMVLILMFDRAYSEIDEIRFSLFKFKLKQFPRPAWDFQYVIHRVAADRDYGFKGRLIWKKFVSAEDCWNEYRIYKLSMPTTR